MIREALGSLARNEALGGVLARTPVARDVVARVVGGEEIEEVLPLAADLADRGYHLALEHVAPEVSTLAEADHAVEGYAVLIDAVADAGLAGVSEVAVFTEALGQGIARADPLARLRELALHAGHRGVVLQMGAGPSSHREQTLAWSTELLAEGYEVGITLPANLRPTEQDVRLLADRRVRLVKGAHAEGAYRQPIEVDKAFIRCAKVLLKGAGQPSFATHDPRLITIVESVARRYDRSRHSYEFAFYLGRQTGEQERLLAEGERVRIYVPYGHRWLQRLVGGLAEQPSGIGGALRSLLPG